MSTLLALIAFLLPTYLVRFEIAGIPSTLLELLIWLVFLVGLVRLVSDVDAQDRLSKRRVWLLPALLILIGAVFGLLVTPDLRTGLGLFKGFIVDPILVYLLALAFVETEEDRTTVITGLVAGATGVAAWALIDAGLSPSGPALSGVEGFDGRIIGPYTLDANASPNYLAFAIAPVLPLLIHLTKKHWLWWPVGLLLIAGLVVSGSRAGLVAGIGGLILGLILMSDGFWRSGFLRDCLVTGLLVICLGSWFVVRPDFNLAPEAGGRITTSNNVRFQLWGATGELMRAHWLGGVGLGNFQPAFTELTAGRVNYPEFIAPKARTPHNLLVGVWSEIGLTGLIGLIASLVLVGKALFRGLRQPQVRVAAAALVGSWFVLIAHGLVDQPIWKNDGMILFWLLVALAATLELNPQRTKART